MGWRDEEWESESTPVVHDYSRAVLWGACAVALLAIGGVIFSLLQ